MSRVLWGALDIELNGSKIACLRFIFLSRFHQLVVGRSFS